MTHDLNDLIDRLADAQDNDGGSDELAPYAAELDELS